MEIKKTLYSKQELLEEIEKLDSIGFNSIHFTKMDEKYTLWANDRERVYPHNEKEVIPIKIEEATQKINEYVKKKQNRGIDFTLISEQEEDCNLLSFNLKVGGQYKIADIDCDIEADSSIVKEFRLTLYSDLIPKDELVKLTKVYPCDEAWKIGTTPFYHVYTYLINDLDTILLVLESFNHVS